MQHLKKVTTLPVWVQGGIGLRTAAACYTAGAAGVVLDSQLLLVRESAISDIARARLEAMDGSETQIVGGSLDAMFRAFSRGDAPTVDELRRFEVGESIIALDSAAARTAWLEEIKERINASHDDALWPIGQDAAFAAGLAKKYATVGGVVAAIMKSVRDCCTAVSDQPPLAPQSPLSLSHKHALSDRPGPDDPRQRRAAFAAAVAEGGGLPFLALALMRGAEVDALLARDRASCSATGPGASASSASCRPSCATSSSRSSRAYRRRSR